ncbi:DeoR/GlpR family DNA-binding transcription regulator [Paludicola sp. MB14-C6]|uniref:DeoR/GlpR family DNA-binding transcription regulator n=1 Tax=Paludihabitans sp. MB14-C6 TaxID=3070656 RepID=UPI0027DDAB58|nr:DeoR/GlpR family DNA-binding transcription regulator [Paludicola sp. MB14-C6]WMJ23603.1 DeoR/GlpR family DNA-binding transcription regulator [Paludicola sp. MB14-C6]
MFIEERHQDILNSIKVNGRISIGEIQEKYGVSVDSARRDLRILEEKGLLKRTHGGAIPILPVGMCPPRHRDFDNMTIDEHYAVIAKKAAELIKDGDIIFLTSGTFGFITTMYLPKNIKYTVVLNSPTLADKFKYWDNVTVYLAGGKMRLNGGSAMVDSMATSFIKNLHFDISFLTGAGVTAEFGLSNGTDETATFQRAVIENSRQNILLMPCQKVGTNAFIKVADINKFDKLITDWETVEDEILKIEEVGVEVIVVEK